MAVQGNILLNSKQITLMLVIKMTAGSDSRLFTSQELSVTVLQMLQACWFTIFPKQNAKICTKQGMRWEAKKQKLQDRNIKFLIYCKAPLIPCCVIVVFSKRITVCVLCCADWRAVRRQQEKQNQNHNKFFQLRSIRLDRFSSRYIFQ